MPTLTDHGGWTTATYTSAEVEAHMQQDAAWIPWEWTQTVVMVVGGLMLLVWVGCRWRWYARLWRRRWREVWR